MLRSILFLHRWLGVLIGLLMTIWCLSGFVMMYVDYPRLTSAAQMKGLEPLHLPARDIFARIDLADDIPLAAASVEMVAGRPVLRLKPGADTRPAEQMRITPAAFDLTTAKPLKPMTQREMRCIAENFGKARRIGGDLSTLEQTDMDQWTVQSYRGNAPLYRADFADDAGTQIYIANQSGEVVQETTRFQRFWGWLGAVPHWLYPTLLRQNGPLWAQVVIWTSVIGCFLTVTGLWVGIARLRRKRDGSIGSPFRGIWWWHHIFGLFFGILMLTWVASGLLSMNPWGLLDTSGGYVERNQLAGQMRWADVRSALRTLPNLGSDTVRVETAPLNGQAFLITTRRDGSAKRLADGEPTPLARAELQDALHAQLGLQALERIDHEDSYYYSHKNPVRLPVWRAVMSDEDQTLLYIDSVTGEVIRGFDSNGRDFRWLHRGFHSLDLPVLRTRPIWDLVVIPLLAMVTLVCATGTWMAWNKVKRDIHRWHRRRRKRRTAATC